MVIYNDYNSLMSSDKDAMHYKFVIIKHNILFILIFEVESSQEKSINCIYNILSPKYTIIYYYYYYYLYIIMLFRNSLILQILI